MSASEESGVAALRAIVRNLGRSGPADDLQALLTEADEELRADVGLALQVREQIEHHRQRESELLALYETARDLTELRDVERVLRAIVRRARQLLSSDIGYFSLYDPDRGDYYVRATEGSVSAQFARIRVPPNVGICGVVASDRQPRFSSAYATDKRFQHADAIDDAVLGEQVESILGVPLLAEDRVIGVLFVADRYSRTYTPQQIALLDSLGAHAAVALENARLFQEAREALARERQVNLELQVRTREVQSAADVHEHLTSLLARGGGLDDLAQCIARELAGHVVVADDTLDPISSSYHGRAADAPAVTEEVREAFAHSNRLGRSIHLPSRNVWVASAGGVSGSQGGLVLWREDDLTPSQVRTLERAAMMVALVLLSRERVTAAEHRAMGDLIAGLLKHPQDELESLRRGARRYGVALDGPVSVVVLHLIEERSTQTVQFARTALADSGLVGHFNGELVAIVPGPDGEAVARRMQDEMASVSRGPITAGVARNSDASDLADAYRRASHCLKLLLTLGRDGAIGTEALLSPYALLLSERGRVELERFLEELLAPLLDWDAQRHTDLARTLLTYFDCAHNTTAAASALHIHSNTLRQRLDKITTLLPGWNEPARALDLHLALRLHALRNELAVQPATQP
jgi:sugar diacid utilization regulator